MSKTSNPLANQRKGPSTNVVLTVVVVVVALLVIGGVLLLSGGGKGPSEGAVPPETLRNETSHALIESPNSSVTVTEFFDFQCPGCAQYYQAITRPLEDEYKGKINFVVRNYPLNDIHKLAEPAARAAEAAAMQGKFTEMYHAIYDNWQSWATNGQNLAQDVDKANATFEQYGQDIGLDMAKYKQDLNSDEVTKRIERDIADGQKAGIQGTPTIFINGNKWEPSGAQTYADAQQQLRDKLNEELGK